MVKRVLLNSREAIIGFKDSRNAIISRSGEGQTRKKIQYMMVEKQFKDFIAISEKL